MVRYKTVKVRFRFANGERDRQINKHTRKDRLTEKATKTESEGRHTHRQTDSLAFRAPVHFYPIKATSDLS